jgi:hypothetical protein
MRGDGTGTEQNGSVVVGVDVSTVSRWAWRFPTQEGNLLAASPLLATVGFLDSSG